MPIKNQLMISNDFQIELQASLNNLQEHITEINSAKAQIETAKFVATEVVGGMANLQNQHEQYLSSLNEKIDQFLNSANEQLCQNFGIGLNDLQTVLGTMQSFQHEHAHDSQKFIRQLQTKQSYHLEQLSEQNEAHLRTLETRFSKVEQLLLSTSKSVIKSNQQQSSDNEAFITGIKTQQGEYIDQLLEKNDEYYIRLLENTNSAFEDTVEKLANISQTVIEQVDTQLHTLRATSANIKQAHQDQVNESKLLLQTLEEKQQEYMENLVNNSNEKMLEFASTTNNNVSQTLISFDNQLGQVNELYTQYNDQTEDHLDRYQNMMGSVEALIAQIKNVNFPTRLGTIDTNTINIENALKENQLRTSSIETTLTQRFNAKSEEMLGMIESQQKMIEFMRLILIIFVIINMVGFGLLIYLVVN